MEKPDFDLCVIGGGINGAGIARDAAGRGLSVLLVEQGDLAAATSSASTKLIHGGLRYLEHYEFGLVRDSLKERETLLKMAPHIIWPLSFTLPHEPHLRPAWLIRLGLFLYDNLARRERLAGSRMVRLAGGPLKPALKQGFQYADCWVEDSRLVILNAMDAAARGAIIMTRTACTGLIAREKSWAVQMGGEDPKTARMLVNAAGPWVRRLLDKNGLGDGAPFMRLVKGSHIITRRLFDGDGAFILQQPDRRIVFAIPYEHDFTLIGTTDVEYEGDPATPKIDAAEIDYLCAAFNRSFTRQIGTDDIVDSYSGVRPLLDDGGDAAAVTRDYKLVPDESHGPKLLSVFGGKLTTYRHLAEEAVNTLTDAPPWTAGAALPGGDFADFGNFLAAKKAMYKKLPPALVERCARAYGTRMDIFLSGASLGAHFGDDVYQAEIDYLIAHEFSRTAEDILWRRSKLGLHIAPQTAQNLENYLKDKADAA